MKPKRGLQMTKGKSMDIQENVEKYRNENQLNDQTSFR